MQSYESQQDEVLDVRIIVPPLEVLCQETSRVLVPIYRRFLQRIVDILSFRTPILRVLLRYNQFFRPY